jgi:hypothetical protein
MDQMTLAAESVAEPTERHGHAIDVGSEGVGDDVNSHGMWIFKSFKLIAPAV